MNPSLSLDDRQFTAAMKLLEREQREFLPSRAESLRHRLFNVATTALIAVLVVWLLSSHQGGSSAFELWLFWVFAAVAIANVALFIWNIGLIGKFWRLARLRRRLGLTGKLGHFFDEQQSIPATVFNIVAALVNGLAGVFFLGFWVFILATGNLRTLLELEGFGVVGVTMLGLTLFCVALSLFSQPLMSRAHKRLKIVTGLQESLAHREQATAEEDEAAGFASTAAQVLGEMERSQIISERRQVLRRARQSKAGGYALQQSVAVHRAKGQLDPSTGRKVEDQLQALALDPGRADSAGEDSQNGLRTLTVPETSLEIGYQVEPATRSIKIFHLGPSNQPNRGAAPDA